MTDNDFGLKSLKQVILEYVQTHAGSSTAEVTESLQTKYMIDRQHNQLIEWVKVRAYLDELLADGVLCRKDVRGITRFYPAGET